MYQDFVNACKQKEINFCILIACEIQGDIIFFLPFSKLFIDIYLGWKVHDAPFAFFIKNRELLTFLFSFLYP